MRGNVKVYQKKIVEKRRKRLFFLFLWMVLFVGLILSGLSYLSQLPSLNIKNVKVEGISRLDQAFIIEDVLRHLEKNYFYFFSKSNIFLYPKADIRKDIAGLPLVKDVSIRVDNDHDILVSIAERGESAIWCDTEIVMDCFSIDDNGFIFDRATTTEGIIYKGVIKGDKIGSQLMSPEDFKNMQFFIRELVGLNVGPKEVLMEDAGYMEISLDKGGKIIMNKSDDLSSVLSNLASVLSDKTNVPDVDNFLSDLNYIRLDSGNKIFFKLRTATSSKK